MTKRDNVTSVTATSAKEVMQWIEQNKPEDYDDWNEQTFYLGSMIVVGDRLCPVSVESNRFGRYPRPLYVSLDRTLKLSKEVIGEHKFTWNEEQRRGTDEGLNVAVQTFNANLDNPKDKIQFAMFTPDPEKSLWQMATEDRFVRMQKGKSDNEHVHKKSSLGGVFAPGVGVVEFENKKIGVILNTGGMYDVYHVGDEELGTFESRVIDPHVHLKKPSTENIKKYVAQYNESPLPNYGKIIRSQSLFI